MKKNQHVIPYKKADGKKVWAVKSAGSERVSKICERQSEAEKEARLRARKNGSELVIHNRHGRIRDRNSYRKDDLIV
ncbi:DUF2188 domain-containing protein [Patescibacteria group bacterium]